MVSFDEVTDIAEQVGAGWIGWKKYQTYVSLWSELAVNSMVFAY